MPKENLLVYVVDKVGETFEGRIIVARNQRISDFLNAENAFVPIELHDGTIHLLGRRAISRVAPREEEEGGAPSQGAYYLLGISDKLTKRKSAVSVLTGDGEVFEGHFFVTGDQRLSDLLNRESVFVPFEFLDGKIQLIHRSTISRVVPREEEEGGAPSQGAYYLLGVSNKLTKRKPAVSVVTKDGQIFEGRFFVTGDQRISDLLNGRNAFVPFEIHGATIHLLARSAIGHVVPREDDSDASAHVYQAQAPSKRTKRKSPVSLVTEDGEFFEGHVFVASDQRTSDVLNDGSLFVPFEFLDGKIHLIHRSTISRVVPREEEGGASEGIYFGQAPFRQSKRKSPILVVAKDDEVFEGHFFVGGIQRISDLLNAESEFVPFELLDGTIHLLARSAIRRVVPREDDGGVSEGSYLTQAPFKQSMRRFPAAVITKDDEVFEGHFFVPGRQRLSQVLKVENAFVPFELLDGTIQLLNRSTINRVVPREDEDEDEPSAQFVRDVFSRSAWVPDLVMEGPAEAEQGVDLREFENGVAALASADYETARGVFQPLAEHGLARAQVQLALIYENGHGVPRDYDEARNWYLKAAEQGDFQGQLAVGRIYSKGLGVPQDLVWASMWFIIAAAKGVEDAAVNRNEVEDLMTRADVSKAQRLARKWMAKHGK